VAGPEDGEADDADWPLPDDPQPAASAAAAASDDTAIPRRAATAARRTWPELVIIPIPLVVARNAPANPRPRRLDYSM
jgi:hypothetical protein